jgi:hypothetical protein
MSSHDLGNYFDDHQADDRLAAGQPVHSRFLFNFTMFAMVGAGLHLLGKQFDEKLFKKIYLTAVNKTMCLKRK